ncbi:hypothetical protein [Evansella cellulosilytica]|uniref:Uncharacterized protein n=1 Tax=Evansella cellulosilytica (strain ATCC 21833 / DSM 2522 / FERM P-1141 / JCM 9156 / N-4) TaxID=649639 RepID=E6TSP5_EVAC2|nr:hypothetical protein [Evansella cellulosilytica]ADU29553.1 hypothetical protein Bcell_1288 [Evansella cellulosilytica DSM 2522]
MADFLLKNDTDRSRVLFLILATTIFLLGFYFEKPFLFILIATALMLNSKMERSQNTYIKVYGTVLYIIIIAWYLFQFVLWLYTSFIK